MNLKELKEKKFSELTTLAKKLNLDGASGMRKQELIFALLQEELDKSGGLDVAVNEGRILQVSVIDGRAIISLGKREKVLAGEKFIVMRPGKGGQLMPKGELQVIRVDELVSRVDILSMEVDDTILRDDIVLRLDAVE